jgi:hypothetical protein
LGRSWRAVFKRLWPWRKKQSFVPTNTLDFDTLGSQTAAGGLAFAAIVRNEGKNIAEWLCFHEKAGVDEFFIYDDGSSDETSAIAKTVCKSAKVTVIPWSQRLRSNEHGLALNNQVLAYGHCLSNFGHRFRRMAFLDVDEFVVPVHHNTIPEAIADLAEFPLIVLPWVMFGTSGRSERPDLPTTEAYTMRLTPNAGEGVRGLFNVKCIFNPAAVSRLHVHRMRVHNSLRAFNDRGEAFTFTSAIRPSQLSADRLQLNHYYSRSKTDLEEKILRGGGTYTSYAPRDAELLRARIGWIDDHSVLDQSVQNFMARTDLGESKEKCDSRSEAAEINGIDKQQALGLL